MTEANTSCKLNLASIPAALIRAHLLQIASPTSISEIFGNIVVDSRKIQPGDCFIALRGTSSDAHQFVPEAIRKRAGLLIVENRSSIPTGSSTPYLVVTSSRAAWAYLAAESYHNPQNFLKILAVTGTNGKTSTAWMLGEILRLAGHKCLTLGTLGADFGDHLLSTNHTTPDPDVLFRYLKDAVDRKVSFVAMEASSHAVVQEKLSPLRFSGAAFTSFSRDHLDFHSTLDEYFAAKERIFTELCAPDARQVIYEGLDRVEKFVASGKNIWFYGRRANRFGKNYLAIEQISQDHRGTALTCREPGDKKHVFRIPYFGQHAIENFCAAYLLATSQIALSISDFGTLRHVPGRLQLVSREPTEPNVIVDYAHTPDALEKTMLVLKALCRGQLIVVFGCGGDRDRGKRPIMGHLAGKLADKVYVTSDNPRSENPSSIISEIIMGIANEKKVSVFIDRKEAIFSAITEANPVDTVLIAGKGHENYQIIGSFRLAFDDREIATHALKSRAKPRGPISE